MPARTASRSLAAASPSATTSNSSFWAEVLRRTPRLRSDCACVRAATPRGWVPTSVGWSSTGCVSWCQTACAARRQVGRQSSTSSCYVLTDWSSARRTRILSTGTVTVGALMSSCCCCAHPRTTTRRSITVSLPLPGRLDRESTPKSVDSHGNSYDASALGWLCDSFGHTVYCSTDGQTDNLVRISTMVFWLSFSFSLCIAFVSRLRCTVV